MFDQKPETYVLNGRVGLYQPSVGGFRTSLDSVMLAAACKAMAGDQVLDAGCGVGGAGLCLKFRVPEIHLTGIDINPEFIAFAKRNAEINFFAKDSLFELNDIRHFGINEKLKFDHVIINPPFYEAGSHTPSPDILKQSANGHVDEDLSLEDWLKMAHRVLKSRGVLTLIYPTSGLDKIFICLGRRFGASEIIPLWPRAGEPSKRVIVRTIKDRQPLTTLHAGIILHDDNGYTPEADAILRDGESLF